MGARRWTSRDDHELLAHPHRHPTARPPSPTHPHGTPEQVVSRLAAGRSAADLRRLPPAAVLGLQRAVGNRATSDLLGESMSAGPLPTPHQAPGTKRKADAMVGATGGAGSPGGGASQPKRRSARLADNPDADLNRPTLSFTSSYRGARTQTLDAEQEFSFPQEATLTRPDGVRSRTAGALYHFRQEVTDSWTLVIPDDRGTPTRRRDGRGWAQDGPYQPPYDSRSPGKEMIHTTADSITFEDTPGWSTTSKVGVNEWLESYQVSFRWKVRRVGGNTTWTSPVVTHTLTSPYTDGSDRPANVNPAGSRSWQVPLG